MRKQQTPVSTPVAKKSSGLSDAEIAAMMAKWQTERDQAKADRLNQTVNDLKETSEERNKNSYERRQDANSELDQLEETLSESNKAGKDRNLEEAMLVEEFRKDEQTQRQNFNKDAEENRILKVLQTEVKRKGNAK